MHHGYTRHVRDYEIVVHMTADPRTGVEPGQVRYFLRYCVEARWRTTVQPDTWRASLDDRLIDHERGVDVNRGAEGPVR